MRKSKGRKGPAKGAERHFTVSHLASSKFAKRGLRGYFEYRDLGINGATRGGTVTHVIRAGPANATIGDGEGIGTILMKAGSCFYQPPRIRHRELAHSKNVEMIEVVSPANFKTYAA